ncbi:MAG: type 1 glutamine amidotransferase [Betaproteobacteria bacterium]
MRPVAIFRFSPTEGPGHFGDWLDRHGVSRRLIALDEGEAVPGDVRAFAGVGMMGGPMSANDELPWNTPLLELLRQAVAGDIPVVGHCLGGQLFAKALGARVARTATPEIGWGEVITPDRAATAWFGGRDRFTTFQWHYDIFELPPGATRVLTNAFNPQQGFAMGKHIGFQCHIEMTREMVETWCGSGAGELPAQSNGARQNRDDIFRDLDARLTVLSQVADDVYARWARGLAR